MRYSFYSANNNNSRFSYRMVMISFVITAALFIMLPLSESLFRDSSKKMVREVNTMEMIKKAPPIEPPPRKKQEKPKPELNRDNQKMTILPVAMTLDPGYGEGDFALDFGLDHVPGSDNMVFEISEVDKRPELIHQIKPLYPIAARHQRIEGRVVLEFVVKVDGMVEQVIVKQSDPPGIFDEAAVQAVRKWKFRPGTKDNKPVAIRVALPMVFNMD